MTMRWVLSLLLLMSLLGVTVVTTVDANAPAPSIGAGIDDDDDDDDVPAVSAHDADSASTGAAADTNNAAATNTILPTPEQLECSVCEIVAAHITAELLVADENPKKMLQVGHRLHMNSHTGVKERKKVLYNRSETHISEIADGICDALLDAKPSRFASKVLMHGRWHYSRATKRDPMLHEKFVRFDREKKALRRACNRMLQYDEPLMHLLTHTTRDVPTAELELKHRVCRVVTPFCRGIYDGKISAAQATKAKAGEDGGDDDATPAGVAGAMMVDDGERDRLRLKGLIDADGGLVGVNDSNGNDSGKKKRKKKKRKRREIIKPTKKEAASNKSSDGSATADAADATKTEL